jgi:predicted peroxiredoxin
MRSTRASAAVARLNQRSEGHDYRMVITSTGLFLLREKTEAGEIQLSDALPLDDFVRVVNAMGPQIVRRITKNDAAFAKQLVKKPKE